MIQGYVGLGEGIVVDYKYRSDPIMYGMYSTINHMENVCDLVSPADHPIGPKSLPRFLPYDRYEFSVITPYKRPKING